MRFVAAGLQTDAARIDGLDLVRGLAVVWMASFHICFDLNYFGFIRQNFYEDPFWTVQRTCIVTLFISCAGVGQAIAIDRRQPAPRFWRRWAQIAGCALLVSIGSYAMFPRSFISFGVLHAIAVLLILMRLSAGAGRWLWPLGAIALLLPQFVRSAWFDSRWFNWIGLVTHKPLTEDYVPVLPWLGVMWWSFAVGQWMLRHRRAWLSGTLPAGFRPLAALGRWSLTFYMLHQPVLIGLLGTWIALRAA